MKSMGDLLDVFNSWIDKKLEEPLIKSSLDFIVNLNITAVHPTIENIPSEFIGNSGMWPLYNYYMMMIKGIIIIDIKNGMGAIRPLDIVEKEMVEWIRMEAECAETIPDELRIIYPNIDSIFINPPDVVKDNHAKLKIIMNILGKNSIITDYNEACYLIILKS